MKQLKLTGAHGTPFYANLWDAVKKPKGIILIAHNLKEDLSWYDQTANWFNKQGYLVCANYLRHHSPHKEPELDDFDYFKENVNDTYLLAKVMTETFDKLSLTIIGVGFGVYVAKRFLEICNFATNAIFIGAGSDVAPNYKLTQPVGFLLHLFSRKKDFAKNMDKMLFLPLKIHFKNNNYITTDKELFNTIEKSKNFSKLLPLDYYYSYLNNIIFKDRNLKNINKKVKLTFLSGELDPIATNHNLKQTVKPLVKHGLNVEIVVLEYAKQNLLLENKDLEILPYLLDIIERKKTKKPNPKKES